MVFGAPLETLVRGERLTLARWNSEPIDFFHCRDRYDNEGEFVMEDSRGQVLGIEVKAPATVMKSDFSGLRKLAEACEKSVVMGWFGTTMTL